MSVPHNGRPVSPSADRASVLRLLAFAVAQGLFLPFLPAWTRSCASLSAPRPEEDA